MKQSKFTEAQIAFAPKQAQEWHVRGGYLPQVGISQVTFNGWHKKFGGLGVSELRRLRQLEEENASSRSWSPI